MKRTSFLLLALFAMLSCGLCACEEENNTPGGGDNPGGGTTQQGGFDNNGASNATFSVSATETIQFSRGNLQYQASTGTWRFAESQLDFVGDANSNISSNNSGWIDLFGWGTSGWNNGAQEYMPYSSSPNFQHYLRNVDLTGSYAEADWGWHNAISNGGNQTHMWRTMTVAEWEYLLGNSGNRAGKWGLATIGGNVRGMVILPDNWTTPSGLTWTAGHGSYGYYDDNVYTTSQWSQMEAAGAIFLPAAGDREGDAVYNVGYNGNYWSASHDPETQDYSLRGVHFHDGAVFCPAGDSPRIGYSVRLVRAKNSGGGGGTTTQGGFDANGASNATFSVSSGKTIHFSRGNLQYQASSSTWRFAEDQLEYVGNANAAISATNSGWIDLFAYGTSGWNSGVVCYMPYSASWDFQDYLRNVSLTGSYAEADWGWHNAISNGGNQAHMWRTMTVAEWQYLLGNSGNRAGKWGLATIGGNVRGMIILPDNWTTPSGLSWTAGHGSYGYYDDNVYTTSQWNQMEAAGAIFLPAAGDREGDAVYNVGYNGNYWSSSHDSETEDYSMRGVHFHDGAIFCPAGDSPRIGYSVRLVKD